MPGPLSTVQDLGRRGFGRYGVPPSGALDGFALRVANRLVGNPEGEAGLELTLPGFRARLLADLAVAVTGADLKAHCDGEPLPPWQCRVLRRGQVLALRGYGSGCRAYVALGGGIDVPPVMGSKATNLGTGFGGFEGRALGKGDILKVTSPQAHLPCHGRTLPAEAIPVYTRSIRLKVIPGPQDRDFAAAVRRRFYRETYRVRPASDRAGIRLSGPLLECQASLPESIISEGVVPGAVQVPGDGQPIIILNETVTGGYRKIATVIAADLFRLAQLKPGDQVRFCPVSLEAARAAWAGLEARIRLAGEGLPRL